MKRNGNKTAQLAQQAEVKMNENKIVVVIRLAGCARLSSRIRDAHYLPADQVLLKFSEDYTGFNV